MVTKNPFAEAKSQLLANEKQRDAERAELRERFHKDCVAAALGEIIDLSYLPTAIELNAVTASELDKLPIVAERLVASAAHHARHGELARVRDEADKAWLDFVARSKAEREQLGEQRRLAINGHASATGASTTIAELRREFPGFVGIELTKSTIKKRR